MPLWEGGKYAPPPEGLLWEREEGFEAALNNFANFGMLRKYSLDVIQSELNAHTADGRHIWLMNSIGNESQDA